MTKATRPASSPAVVTDRSILAIARRSDYPVGANRKGASAGASWSLLLPRLPLERVAVIGTPEPWARERLSEVADEIVEGLTSTGSVDLIWVVSDGVSAPDRIVLRAFLTEGGLIVDERPEPGIPIEDDVLRVRVLRRDGDTIVAIPAGQPFVERWLERHGLAGRASARRRGRLRERLPAIRRGQPAAAAWGSLDLVGRADLYQPPQYLRDIAVTEGVAIEDHGWALSATGQYRTQKAIIPLFAPATTVPEIIVKVTRHASVNPRLQVELDGLRRLASVGPSIAERVPIVRFAGFHADLLVVGESVLDGDRFNAPDAHRHPLAADAVAWLTELAMRTTDWVDPTDVSSALSDLVDAYVTVDGPGSQLAGPLRAQVEQIRRHPDPFPVVVQHGDPGTWNLLAMPGTRTGFLDWENMETRGMPLWDLFYLLRSLAVGSSPRRPLERRFGHVHRTFLDTSELTPFIVDAVRRYCGQVGVADDLVEPIYHLGWMYQALKEVTRLTPGHLGEGHFYALLRRGLERRGSGTLDRLVRGNHR